MSNAVTTLLTFYTITIVINIAIASLQYAFYRSRVHITILFYWIGILIAAIINTFFTDLNFQLVLFAGTGTFISQTILGAFFCQIRHVSINLKLILSLFLCTTLISYGVSVFNNNFSLYSLIFIIGATTPLLISCHQVLKSPLRPLTLIQKIFCFLAIIMSLHYTTWAFTRPQPELFDLGLIVAMIITSILSILTPTMANEYSLQQRMERLETEVHLRAEQLTQAEQKLWESNKFASLGRMAGGIAHEINNPLSIIYMHAENLKESVQAGIVDTEEVLRSTTKIEEVVERISKITTNLRKVARDKNTIQKNWEDLQKIINETTSLCNDRMKISDISFTLHSPPGPIPFYCNSIEISQVLLNLLNNAIDAIENTQKKEIHLTVEKDASTLIISIEDSGHIDPQHIPQIMEPFFTTKSIGKGTGLGLSISKSIVESHGGRLFLDMSSITTKFVIELPYSENTLPMEKSL